MYIFCVPLIPRLLFVGGIRFYIVMRWLVCEANISLKKIYFLLLFLLLIVLINNLGELYDEEVFVY